MDAMGIDTEGLKRVSTSELHSVQKKLKQEAPAKQRWESARSPAARIGLPVAADPPGRTGVSPLSNATPAPGRLRGGGGAEA
eukprot:gene6512-4076_t